MPLLHTGSYPRTLSGVLVVVLCVGMAVYSYQANVLISAAVLGLALLRGWVLVQDIRRARAQREQAGAGVGEGDAPSSR